MRRARILVVDDNRVNRLLLTGLLESAGHHVEDAGSGREAVDGVRLLPYDLVLMDVQMPGMSGLEAAVAIRALGGIRGAVPIVGITGDSSEEMAAQCRAAGMNDYLPKPIRPEAIEEVVRRWAGARTEVVRREGDSSGLGSGLSAESLTMLLAAFEEDAPRRSAELVQAVRAGALRQGRSVAHDLGGAAANLGFEALSRLARSIETACDGAADPETLEQLVGELPAVIEAAGQLIAERRARLAQERVPAGPCPRV